MEEYLNREGLVLLWSKIKNLIGGKVDKVDGKGLSTNDYTTDEKTKLAGIEEGAQANVKPDWKAAVGSAAEILNKPEINDATLTVQVNGASKGTFTANSKTDTTINITAADLGLDAVMHFKGSVESLPTASKSDSYSNGDVILVDNKEYVRSGKTDTADGSWIELGDESSYALKTTTITGTGALSGGGTLGSNRTITHTNSGVTAGTYKSVTVNAYGHVTAGSNPSTISGYGITDAKIANGTITLGSNTITPTTSSTSVAGTVTGSEAGTAGVTGTIGAPTVTINKSTVTDALGYTPAETNTTYEIATSTTAGLVKSSTTGTTAGKDYSVEVKSDGTMKVNVPWTDSDTKNTAGSTNSSNKLFLIGATEQSANPQTYSHDTAYVGTDGCLYSDGKKVLTDHQSLDDYYTKTEADAAFAEIDHTHTTALVTDTGTAAITLAHSGVYKLSAGGTDVVFKMPATGNTDTKVTQTVTSSGTDTYPILFTNTKNVTTTKTEGARFCTAIKAAPNGTLTATKFVGALDGTASKATADADGNTISETYEKVANKVTELSDSSTDVQYPSAKAVYDAIDDATADVYLTVTASVSAIPLEDINTICV